MNLIIDIGNSRIKIALYEKDMLSEIFLETDKTVLKKIKKLFKLHQISSSIISIVKDVSSEITDYLQENSNFILVNHKFSFPFKNLYKTPKTVGVDRLVLSSAAVMLFPKTNVLIIDAGTCITYDFVSKDSEYFGGAISPGLKIRYKSLNDYTSKLPLLDLKQPKSFIGNTTEESIHSGVVNGTLQEIDGVINQYKNKFSHLTIVLTGGDAKFLSKQLKSSIFANQNFLLEGLNKLLIFNDNK